MRERDRDRETKEEIEREAVEGDREGSCRER